MVAFLAAGFFVAVVFLAAGFLVAGLAAAVLVVVFLVPAVSLTLAFFAITCSLDLRLAAVFFLIKPFLTAVSISLCAALSVLADGLLMKALNAVFTSCLVETFRRRRLVVCFARLMADLMIGIL